ncbi:MAG: response regulator [Gammaproteobacteria bacterium]|nr:MAG: response regulator [Gammaproteobacteria bacterium]
MTKKILVVDDEVALTKMVKMNLERTGEYEVRTENKGSMALQAAQEFRPDLILMDVMMPDMGGDEAMQDIRDDPDLTDTPYVFMTAIVTKEETKEGGSTLGGPNEYLAKPVNTEELIETIERLLGD